MYSQGDRGYPSNRGGRGAIRPMGFGFRQQPPEQHYEEAQAPTFHRRGKAPSKQGRDTQRSTKFREDKGKETMAKIKEELDKTLFFGFSMDTKALDGQKIGTMKQARALPVTTRAVGLTTQSMYVKLNQTMKNIPDCPVYSAYRVSLAQLEMKMIRSTSGQYMNMNVPQDQFHVPTMDIGFQQAILGCPSNFNVIANLINAVGNFEYGQIDYQCKVPKFEVPHPLGITFSTLSNTVRALAMPGTPRAVRKYFYERNPLPGAIWTGVRQAPGDRRAAEFEMDPILDNPNDFWPENYDLDAFRADISQYMGLLQWTARKSLKYVSLESKINFDGPGVKTCLVSNKCDNLRNADPRVVNNAIDWAHTPLPQGNLDEFWVPDSLDDVAFFIGALLLSGELPTDRRHQDLPVFKIRGEEICVSRMDHSWTSAFINMMG